MGVPGDRNPCHGGVSRPFPRDLFSSGPTACVEVPRLPCRPRSCGVLYGGAVSRCPVPDGQGGFPFHPLCLGSERVLFGGGSFRCVDRFPVDRVSRHRCRGRCPLSAGRDRIPPPCDRGGPRPLTGGAGGSGVGQRENLRYFLASPIRGGGWVSISFSTRTKGKIRSRCAFRWLFDWEKVW